MKTNVVAVAGLAVWMVAAPPVGCGGCSEGPPPPPDPKCPEVVAITSPGEDQAFKPGAEIPLIGRIEQNQTADLTTLDVEWVITGTPADGSVFPAREIFTHPLETGEVKSTLTDLGVGTYTAKLVGLDTVYGKQCSDMARDFLVVNNPPAIAITSPAEPQTVDPGAEVVITGTASDPDTDDPPESLTLTVEDDMEPALVYKASRPATDGSWTILAYFSVAGLHNNIYVFATDAAGSSGRAGPLQITVNECDPVYRDSDGYSSCENDCDDSDPNINPDQAEVCDDGKDNDCDGVTDGAVDADGDGFDGCSGGDLRDCDDTQANTYPGASEQCDGLDNNCDGVVPDSEVDNDGDGYRQCGKDCDDEDPITYTGASEVCDGKDNDCDQSVPVGEQDRDSDGVKACEDPPDCDDSNDDVSPYAAEVCGNGVDDDCDGEVDEEESTEDDKDGDGHVCDDCAPYAPNIYLGAPEGVDDDGDGIPECDGIDNDCDGIVDNDTSCVDDDGDGYSELDGDCDDYQPYTYPGAIERSDNQDNNCDGQVEGTLSLERAHVRLHGAKADARVGNAVAGGGDVNGDGYEDMVVGAYYYDAEYTPTQGRGAAFLLFGGPTGWEALEGQDLDANAVLLYEEEPAAKAGSAVALLGNLNGDPYADFAVSAPFHSTAKASNVGRTYIIFGKPEGWGTTELSVASFSTVEGMDNKSSSQSLLGFSLSGGDINDDGLDDLLIGVPWETQDLATGFLVIVPGSSTKFEPEINPNDVFSIAGAPGRVAGISVAYTGFNNADGTGDLAVGTYHDYATSPGSVYWLLGNPSFVGPSTIPPDSFPQENAPEYFGTTNYDYVGDSISGAVDLDGDGYDELLVGRRNNTENGETPTPLAYVVFGRDILPETGDIDYLPAMIRFLPSASGADECPCIVQGIGDMDGDGHDDFALGVARNDENGDDAGKIYVFRGKASREDWGSDWGDDDILDLSVDTADLIVFGENAGDMVPGSMSAGDLNSDGRMDLIIGVPAWRSGEDTSNGQVYVLFGYPDGRNPSPYN